MSEILEYKECLGGEHISNVAAGALAMAMKAKRPVRFTFNDTEVIVQPTDSRDGVVARWQADFDAAAKAYREHPDRIIEQAAAEAEAKAEREAHMVDTSSTEKEMRDADVPWPKTKEQLTEYIESLASRQHDYGTCVYAMSMAATAAFNYIAGQLGVTGFQSSMADLDILRRTRHLKGPFMIVNGEDALYPQYDIVERVEKALEEWKPWLKEEAEKKLADTSHAHPNVLAHWKSLAEVGDETVK